MLADLNRFLVSQENYEWRAAGGFDVGIINAYASKVFQLKMLPR